MTTTLRRWMLLCEAEARMGFVGTCRNAFDEDGDCTVPQLPWRDVSALAYADENAKAITRDEFYAVADVPQNVERRVRGHEIHYLDADGVYMLYDVDRDIHYFFARH